MRCFSLTSFLDKPFGHQIFEVPQYCIIRHRWEELLPIGVGNLGVFFHELNKFDLAVI